MISSNRSTKLPQKPHHPCFTQALLTLLLRAHPMQGIPLHPCHQQRPGRARRRLHGLVHLPAPLMLRRSRRARAASKRGDTKQSSRPHRQHARMPSTTLWKALKIRRKPNISREGRGEKKISKGFGSCRLPFLPSPPEPSAIHVAEKCSQFRGYQRILIPPAIKEWMDTATKCCSSPESQ